MGEPNCARLPLLDTTPADSSRVVGGTNFRMVETFLHIRGPLRGNPSAVFDLGAAAAAFFRIRLVRLVADHDRAHGKLLFLQSAHDRVVFSLARRHSTRAARNCSGAL